MTWEHGKDSKEQGDALTSRSLWFVVDVYSVSWDAACELCCRGTGTRRRRYCWRGPSGFRGKWRRRACEVAGEPGFLLDWNGASWTSQTMAGQCVLMLLLLLSDRLMTVGLASITYEIHRWSWPNQQQRCNKHLQRLPKIFSTVMCCEKMMMTGWRNVWSMKLRVQD